MARANGRRLMGDWGWTRPLRAGISPASGPDGFYLVVVVVALLFCHGAFGYAHQFPVVDATAGDATAAHVAHVTGGHQPDPGGEAEASHLGDAYFATLLVLLFGALLLPGGRVSAALRVPVPAGARGDLRAGGLPPPRGPTLYSLQVLRL